VRAGCSPTGREEPGGHRRWNRAKYLFRYERDNPEGGRYEQQVPNEPCDRLGRRVDRGGKLGVHSQHGCLDRVCVRYRRARCHAGRSAGPQPRIGAAGHGRLHGGHKRRDDRRKRGLQRCHRPVARVRTSTWLGCKRGGRPYAPRGEHLAQRSRSGRAQAVRSATQAAHAASGQPGAGWPGCWDKDRLTTTA